MTRSILISLPSVLLLLGSVGSSSALTLSLEFDYGASVVANGLEPAAPHVAKFTSFTAGDIIALVVSADNTPNDVVTAIFATLAFDGTQLQYLGGGFTGPILEGTCTGFSCVNPELGPGIGSPVLKPLSPFGQSTGSTDWLQVIAHTNPLGTNSATTPVSAVTSTLGFLVLPGATYSCITCEINLMIEPNSDTVAGPGGGAFAGPVNLVSVSMAPEPGTALLVGLGLMALGASGRRSY